MDDNKKKFGGFGDAEDLAKAPRARNRTVMLTPEIAGEMRSHLKSGHGSGGTEEIGSGEIEQAKQNVARSSQAAFRPAVAASSNAGDRPGHSFVQTQRPVMPGVPVAPAPVIPKAEPEERFDFNAELEEPAPIKAAPIPLSRPEIPKVEAPVRAASRPVIAPPVVEEEIEEIEEEIEEVVAPVVKARVAAPVKSPVIDSSEDHIHWVKESKLCGFLVSYDRNPNGEVHFLRSGRLVVSSEKAGTGNLFLINDESVSPMHAILRIASGSEIQVLDQLSESGTKIERVDGEVVELSGDKTDLQHGDKVSFGDRTFIVCLIGT